MFCGECGTKNKKGSLFCAECGARVEGSELEATEEKEEVEERKESKPKKPMSKKQKLAILAIVLVVAILGIGYKLGSDATSPKAIAKKYITALADSDWDYLYQYIGIEGDSTFASKDIFKDLMSENNAGTEIANFKIKDVTYSSGNLNAEVDFVYTTKNNSSEQNGTVYLTKQKDKKYLFFDDWKISNFNKSSMVVEDYEIKVLKDSVVTYAGVEVDAKYKDANKSNEQYDVYLLPQVFMTSTTLKVVLASGLEVEDTVSPSSYYTSYTLSFDEDSLSEAEKTKITNQVKEDLTLLYTKAIANTPFADFQSEFAKDGLDLTTLQNDYQELVTDLSDAYNVLTSINFTGAVINDVELTSAGNLEIDMRVNYDYTVSYTSWNDEVSTHSDSDYNYVTVVLNYDNGSYYLVGVDDLMTYFSRY